MFRTGLPVDEKFLFKAIPASRKPEGKKVIFFLAHRRVKVSLTAIPRFEKIVNMTKNSKKVLLDLIGSKFSFDYQTSFA